jgi:hypothetical protein
VIRLTCAVDEQVLLGIELETQRPAELPHEREMPPHLLDLRRGEGLVGRTIHVHERGSMKVTLRRSFERAPLLGLAPVRVLALSFALSPAFSPPSRLS